MTNRQQSHRKSTLQAYSSGSAESTPDIALVLVHGFPFDGEIWRGTAEALGGEAVRVYAPDLPGFGQSAPLEGKPEDATVDDYADALAEWARGEGLDKIVLAGHSMGGYVALAFARKYAKMLAGLVLVATKAGADTEAGREGRYKMAAGVEERGAVAAMEAMLPKMLAPGRAERDPGLEERVREVMMRQSPEGIRAALHAMAARPDSTPRLGEIRVPTLVVSGAQDAIMPAAEAETLHSRIRGATHAVIEGAGHLPMLENPAAFNEALASFRP